MARSMIESLISARARFKAAFEVNGVSANECLISFSHVGMDDGSSRRVASREVNNS